MTVRQMIDALGGFSMEIALALTALPLFALLLRLLHGSGGGARNPFRYGYSLLTYLSAIPGMFAIALTAYALFFTSENLLDQPIVIYIAPIVSMALTFMLIAKFVDLKQIPGFDRLTGLMVLLGLTFFVVLLLSRLRLWLGFFGGIGNLVVLSLFVFALLKWAAGRVGRGPGEPIEKPPEFPYS